MTILVIGGTGILGSELQKLFKNCLIPSHDELDITNRKQIFDYFSKNDFDCIMHTAALTSVRKCESEKKLCWSTNVEGTKNLVDATSELKPRSKLIYISTACVFDGHSGMYVESSLPYPENFYALTKLLGEREVTKITDHLIIRTNFVGKKAWSYPKAFTDRFGTYLFSDKVALGIKEVFSENLNGIIHIAGNKKISMFDLAKLTTPSVLPMTIKDYEGPRLTMDMSLDTERWKKYHLE